jgi:VWFA-related protein
LDSDTRNNEYFLMSFNTSQDLVLDFTQDKNHVHGALQKVADTEPKGNTAFYSALNAGFEKIKFSKYRKRALVVVTDAIDNSSDITYSQLKERMKKWSVPVYFVSTLGEDLNTRSGSSALSNMQSVMGICGGSTVDLKKKGDLDAAMLQLGREIQNQYLIGFKLNTNRTENGKGGWRPLEVKVNLPKDSKLGGKAQVRVSKGYYFEKKGS